tara:strand:- start:463 stop:624 length:162 start_codon:yes stop_codon:yes gene_type:complete
MVELVVATLLFMQIQLRSMEPSALQVLMQTPDIVTTTVQEQVDLVLAVGLAGL